MRHRSSTLVHFGALAANAIFLLAIALFIAASVIPQVSGVELRNVVSGSMEPSVQKGALVVSVPVSFASLHEGDVVVFRAPDGSNRVVTHRVAATHDDGGLRTLETRGDANEASDPWRLQARDVMGKVRLDVPKAGSIVEHIRSPEGFLLLVVLPGLVLLLGEFPLWIRTLGKRRRQREAANLEDDTPGRERVASPFFTSIAVLSACVIAVTLAMYALAPRPNHENAALTRVSDETASIVNNSAVLADGEAFDGDIQLLRNADDPRLRDPSTSPADRVTALRQMLLLNTNRFEAFSILDLTGRVIATTDETQLDTGDNPAYVESRDRSGVAASFGDISIHYAAPVLDGAGVVQGVLLGRTTAERLWSQTLATSIDGSRTSITSVGGTNASALPDVGSEVKRIDWAGSEMYCASRPIGENTHLDGGLRVTTCLPSAAVVSTSYSERRYLGESVLTVVAAIIVGGLLLAFTFRTATSRRTEAASVRALEARLLSQRQYHP